MLANVRCPSWVKRRNSGVISACLLWPQKRTSLVLRVRALVTTWPGCCSPVNHVHLPFAACSNVINVSGHRSFSYGLHCFFMSQGRYTGLGGRSFAESD